MRKFPYLTVGRVLKLINEELRNRYVGEGDAPQLSRRTFYVLEEQGLFTSKRSAGGWRVYSPTDTALIKELILQNYGLSEIVGAEKTADKIGEEAEKIKERLRGGE